MKSRLLALTAAAAAFTLAACDKAADKSKTGGDASASSGSSSTGGGAPSKEAALEAFKAEAIKLKEWADKNEPDKSNPAAGMALIGQMGEKMRAIKTAGLPEDLKTAWDNMLKAFGKMETALKDLPKDAEGMTKFFTEKATADPGFMAKFQADMAAAGTEMTAAGEALKEAGKKHGIDLDLQKD